MINTGLHTNFTGIIQRKNVTETVLSTLYLSHGHATMPAITSLWRSAPSLVVIPGGGMAMKALLPVRPRFFG